MPLEQFANTPVPSVPSTPWTTLSGSINSSTTTIPVTGFVGFPGVPQYRILVDNEWILITAGTGTTAWTGTRGIEGSTPAAHASGTPVFLVLTSGAQKNNPRSMTTSGDTEYLGPSQAVTRLPIGTEGQVKRVTGGLPAWSTLQSSDISDASVIGSNVQTANYTPVLTDGGKVVEMNVGTPNTLTVPPNSAVAFPVGTIIEVYQMGAGQTTITPGAGVTFRAPTGTQLLGQYTTASLRKRSTNEWVLSGALGSTTGSAQAGIMPFMVL